MKKTKDSISLDQIQDQDLVDFFNQLGMDATSKSDFFHFSDSDLD